jgi:hypothetical protein
MNQPTDRFPDLENEDDAPIPGRGTPEPGEEDDPTSPYFAFPCLDVDDPANG